MATVVAACTVGAVAGAGSAAAAPVAYPPTLSTFAGTGTQGAATAGPALASGLNAPFGVAVDTAGNVYIADTNNNQIHKVTPSGTLSIFAGTGAAGSPTAGPATASALRAPFGVAADTAGNVYIADSNNNQIHKVTPSGTLSIFAGTGAAGSPTAGPATASTLNGPTGVAVDTAGNVYIADMNNNLVEKVTPSGTLSIFAGTGATGAPTPGPATASGLNFPSGVAVDTAGNVYINDWRNNRVEKVDSSGTLSTIAGSGTQGAATAGPATASAFNSATGVAVDTAGNVYIADRFNHQIQKVDSSGTLSTFAGTGAQGAATAGPATASALDTPSGVAVDTAGNVYIADRSNHLVEKVTVPPGTLPTISDPVTMRTAGTVGSPYTYGGLTVSAGASTVTWSVASGVLPTGMTLNTSTGAVTGTPTAAGTTNLTLKASTTAGYDTIAITVLVRPAPPVVSGGWLPQQQVTTAAPKAVSLTARTFALNATATPSSSSGSGSSGSGSGSAGTGGKLSYSSQTTGVCTVDDSGVVTVLKAGTCTLTVSAAATSTSAFTTKTVDISITAPQASVTALPAGAQRFAGADRVATSADIAAKVFPTPTAGTSLDVVIATAGSYADALAGSRLAGQVGGPLLLTNGNQLSDEAAEQVKRLVAAGGTVYLLGGDKALSEEVEQATSGLVTGDTVVRVGGANRYETAAMIADATTKRSGDVGPIYLVTGKDFADGVSVAAYAQSTGGVVLLTDGDTLPAATAKYLTDHDPKGTRAVAIGGPAKTAATTAGLSGAASRAVVGADRFETSAKLAAAMKAGSSSSSASSAASTVASVGLAGGASWPDALSGSAAMAALGGPLLLTPTGTDAVPSSTASALSGLDAKRVLVFGGTSVITGSAFDKAGALLNS